jgi:SAM-dependent methyltransferase
MVSNELDQEFEKRAPWITRFVIDGAEYGGSYDYRADPRTDWFLSEFPDAQTVLDLGSLEGAQSLRLAEHSGVAQVVGIEARPANIEKAEFIHRTMACDKVRFRCADLEVADLTEFGHFDAVFCAGVLYHLPEPWHLLRKIAEVSDNLFLWTHFALDEKADRTLHGYQGLMYREGGWDDPQSGTSPESFWPNFSSLQCMLEDAGFEVRRVINKTLTTQPGPITALSAVRCE